MTASIQPDTETTVTAIVPWSQVTRGDRVLFAGNLYKIDAVTAEGDHMRAWLGGWNDSRLFRACTEVAIQRTLTEGTPSLAAREPHSCELSLLRARCAMYQRQAEWLASRAVTDPATQVVVDRADLRKVTAWAAGVAGHEDFPRDGIFAGLRRAIDRLSKLAGRS